MSATPARDNDSLLPLELPAVARKKVTVAFDGGRLSSDGGVLLLREVERHFGLAERLAACMTDRRDSAKIDHTVVEMLRLRMFAIAVGYEDADDCDTLRNDPVFKMAVGRAPETGDPLCSQPTMSRLENAPSKVEIARMMAALVDLFCASWARPPASITLDIDDTVDAVHGHQQLSLFHAHYDERCFLPIHIYEAQNGTLVAVANPDGQVGNRFDPLVDAPGFTRGLAFWEAYGFVGTSKIIEGYESPMRQASMPPPRDAASPPSTAAVASASAQSTGPRDTRFTTCRSCPTWSGRFCRRSRMPTRISMSIFATSRASSSSPCLPVCYFSNII